MRRDPNECPFRIRIVPGGDAEAFACALAGRIVGATRAGIPRLRPGVCGRCCEYRLPSPEHVNPVIASLVFQAAAEINRDPTASWRDREEAARAQRLMREKLAILPPADATDAGPSHEDAPGRRARPQRPPLRWAAGLITAPRPEPTIDRTLQSLEEAGFAPVHIFAEPGSWIPETFHDLPRTVHGRRLGNLGNFYTALASLFLLEPEADAYLMVQDDIAAARGLRGWCDEQLWPHGVGLVSLYTCGVLHARQPGWRVLETGRYHTFGALAFVFRRDVLKGFLTDGRLLEYREGGVHSGSDGIVGEWAARHRIGIAYHTPSLVAHIGKSSSLTDDGHGIAGPLTRTRAVPSVGDLGTWTAPARCLGKVGLVGWNTASGLGYLNRDLATQFPVERWLVPTHPYLPTLPSPPTPCRIDRVPLDLGTAEKAAWLRGLDWVLFAELPYLPGLVHHARGLGIQVACVPMWEGLDLAFDWLPLVNVMICPTRYCFDLVRDWKRRFGFAWDVEHVPWPIDPRRFRSRRRTTCERFLFVNGTGGGRPTRADGTTAGYRRKGMEIVLEAARLLRPIPFLIYSQVDSPLPIPDNVDLRLPAPDNRRLYHEADVCVQPSHWEGLGLQLLECQAAGLPLVTTDAPPMNEFQPLLGVPAPEKEIVSVLHDNVITSHNVSPRDLADALRGLYRADISVASARARSFVEREHSWERAMPLLRRAFGG